MADVLPWIATVATIAGAFMTAANLGARVTGYGFAVFLIGSLSWLATGFLTDQLALAWTNVVLTVLNVFGVWRWLGRQASVEEGGRAAAEASEHTPGEALFPISLLTRAEVKTEGQPLGHCVDAMAGCGSGQLDYLVVSHGGVAGVGERLRKLPWPVARVEEEAVVVTLGSDSLDSLEELHPDQWPAR